MFKVNNKYTRTPEINDVALMFLLLTMNKFDTFV